MANFSYGILTDTCHLGTAQDESGPTLKMLLQRSYNAMKVTQSTVPDERNEIEKMLLYYADDLKLHCVLTTGGTGFSPRDITPEATKSVIQRECPQLALAMALESLKKTYFAALSRAICGIRNGTLIINLPGSKKAVVECFNAIESIIPHAIELIRDMKGKTIVTHENLQRDFSFSVSSKSEDDKVDSAVFVDSIRTTEISDQSSESSFIKALSVQTDNFQRQSSEIDQKSIKVEDDRKEFSKQSSKSDSKDITHLLNMSSSTMNEIILDDEILKVPTRKKSKAEKGEERTKVESSNHVCPHKTAVIGDENDRNSPFPMLNVSDALEKVFSTVKRISDPEVLNSPMNCPPFRASIKDGYAIKSTSSSKYRKVIGFIAAGEKIVKKDFAGDECFKINTGAAIPAFADSVVQIEDTKLIKEKSDGSEEEIELLTIPKAKCDIREIGVDLLKGETLFTTNGLMDVPEKTILASVGIQKAQKTPRIAVISTGDELVDPNEGELNEGQIYDSNSTMLKLLLQKHGFEVKTMKIAKDDYKSLKTCVVSSMKECDVIISSGGVSMGDKDFVKPLMKELGFEIHFGRVNMKPGKPMTFASNGDGKSYFALPGNPVSAYVTFHIFVLPALRFMCGFPKTKCQLPTINAILQKDKYTLDPRPEYARAKISFDVNKGLYYAHMPDNQMSSRLASLIDADVLLHLPAATTKIPSVNRGFKVKASILNLHFISDYQG
ncbi:CLUMA_CG014218, isoform A [Clunio marinus]|uniref:CLUMA_CG014218, isoform A n=1 Tax=Clunio marinus TaxID=568069 RepID=A0A1J1ILR6_9DIPT|nr:CLUMA_CG014218, isoform A [Clunio marinus]